MIHNSSAVGEEAQWAPVADLMAVLMLVFMFIAILFIRDVVSEAEIADAECDKIYQLLDSEFRDDFGERGAWGGVDLLPDLTIRFRNPEVLFATGSVEITPLFKNILSDFFPRYMAIIKKHEEQSDNEVNEIRIEGHTSSEYETAKDEDDAYFKNMALSQGRTRSILQYVLTLRERAEYQWARERITANGLSSSRLVKDEFGNEDELRSRRVEFRLLVSSCQDAGRYDDGY